MRPRLLHRPSQHRRLDIMLCSHNLRSRTYRTSRMGMVYLGCVPTSDSSGQELTRFSALASVNFLDGTKIEQQRILLAVYPLL